MSYFQEIRHRHWQTSPSRLFSSVSPTLCPASLISGQSNFVKWLSFLSQTESQTRKECPCSLISSHQPTETHWTWTIPVGSTAHGQIQLLFTASHPLDCSSDAVKYTQSMFCWYTNIPLLIFQSTVSWVHRAEGPRTCSLSIKDLKTSVTTLKKWKTNPSTIIIPVCRRISSYFCILLKSQTVRLRRSCLWPPGDTTDYFLRWHSSLK